MKSLLKITLVLALLLVSGMAMVAQKYTLKGRVIDMETKLAISYASVVIIQTKQGTMTDSTGYFELHGMNADSRISFSCLGYKKKSILVSNTTEVLLIQMEPEVHLLNELVVSATHSDEVLKDRNLTVVDYGFMEGNLLLITYLTNIKQSTLTLLTPELDSLSSIPIPAKPEELYKDCLGNYHVLCNEDVYQVYVSEDGLQMMNPVSRNLFDNTMLSCIAQDEAHLYLMEKYGGYGSVYNPNVTIRNHTIKYICVAKQTKTRTDLLTIVDSDLIMNRERDKLFTRRLVMAGMAPACAVATYDAVFDKVLLYRDIYSPLLVINDTTYIFDFIHASISTFYQKNWVRTTPIDFHNLRGWKRTTLFDGTLYNAYSVFEQKGMTGLMHLDLQTGRTRGFTNIPRMFAENFEVNNDFIYYLWKDSNAHVRLYRTLVSLP